MRKLEQQYLQFSNHERSSDNDGRSNDAHNGDDRVYRAAQDGLDGRLDGPRQR